jgi:CheY-like chemotaxis protein
MNDPQQGEEKMRNRRILVVGRDKTLAWQLYNDLGKREQCIVHNELNGERVHRKIKKLSPDLIIVDLETPGLVKSWITMQLENNMQPGQTPVIMMSEIMNQEEREIVTDMTGCRVLPKKVPLNQLNSVIESSLLN